MVSCFRFAKELKRRDESVLMHRSKELQIAIQKRAGAPTPGFQICEWAGLSAAIGHHREVFQALAHPLRPGRNVTGSSFFVPKLNAKRLEILKEALPRLSRVGVLLKRGNAVNAAVLRTMEHTARSLKLELQPSRRGIRRTLRVPYPPSSRDKQARSLCRMIPCCSPWLRKSRTWREGTSYPPSGSSSTRRPGSAGVWREFP